MEESRVTEIIRLIKNLKPKMSTDFDFGSTIMIKRLLSSYIDCLVKRLNIWLSECCCPGEWKIVKIITSNKLKACIPKCDQTRPISLLAIHLEHVEKVLLNKITSEAESNHIVPQEQ